MNVGNSDKPVNGLWIPATLLEAVDRDITFNQAGLVAKIRLLDDGEGCVASNEYLSKSLGVKANHLSRWVSDLTEKGYLVRWYTGITRRLAATPKAGFAEVVG